MEAKIECIVKQLQKGSNSRVYNALVALRTKYLKDQTNVVCFLEHGGPQALVELIQRPNDQVVDIALSILGNCCLDKDVRKTVSRIHGVDHIVKILECLEKASILSRACRTIANLALDDSIAIIILKSNAVKCIIEILKLDKSDSCLKQSAVRALRILASSNISREKVVQQGTVQCLVDLLIADNELKDEDLVICILRCMVAVTQNCSLNCAEQLNGGDCIGKLVILTSHSNKEFQKHSLHILANLSRQAVVRPLLGKAGIVKSLVVELDKWEKSSSSWQWAVDILCYCTREAVNRLKFREGGALKHLVSLLKEQVDERLWLCALSSIINFMYDDISFSCLVDLGMVEALVHKLDSLSLLEKAAVHGCPRDEHAVELEARNSAKNILLSQLSVSNWSESNNGHQHTGQCISPHVCCYSPESSPPYWTSFPSCSSPSTSYQCTSPCSFSPPRESSPYLVAHLDELRYSPVYESGDSDDEVASGNVSSLVSTNSDNTSAGTASPAMLLSEEQEQVSLYSEKQTNGRSPIGDILLLLSRLSLEDIPRPAFICKETLIVLLNHVVNLEVPHGRAQRILSRIAHNPLCFEHLILMGMPAVIVKKLIVTPHLADECSACDSTQAFGQSLLRDLRFQAESPFGSGVLRHLTMAGKNLKEKIMSVSASMYIVRSAKSQKHIILDADAWSVIREVLSDGDHSDFGIVLDGIIFLARLLLSPSNETFPDICQSSSVENSCFYLDYFKKHKSENDFGGDNGIVKLSVCGQGDRHIRAHKSVLSSKCDVFNAMLCGSFAESRCQTVTLQDTTLEALEYVVHHLYGCRHGGCSQTRCLQDDASTVNKILLPSLALGDKLLLSDVKNSVVDQLIGCLPFLSDEDCVSSLLSSKLYDCSSLTEHIVKNLLTCSRLSVDQVKCRFQELSKADEGFVDDIWKTISSVISANFHTSIML